MESLQDDKIIEECPVLPKIKDEIKEDLCSGLNVYLTDDLLKKGEDVTKMNMFPSKDVIKDLFSLVGLVTSENQKLVATNIQLNKEMKSMKLCLKNTMLDLEKSKLELREIQGSLMRVTVKNLSLKHGHSDLGRL